jgi:hypothetical protein
MCSIAFSFLVCVIASITFGSPRRVIIAALLGLVSALFLAILVRGVYMEQLTGVGAKPDFRNGIREPGKLGSVPQKIPDPPPPSVACRK